MITFTNLLIKAFILITFFILFIPLAVVVIIIKLSSKGPVLHWSKRIGYNNKIFLMPKFRTMHLNAPDLPTHLLKEHEKYSFKFGSFLRKTSIDEIPQLWSVFVGDMNIVGPRPALHNQDDLVSMRTDRGIHLLKPGITGLAQVKGRDEISIPLKVDYDYEYLQRKSLIFDVYIIFLTVINVLRKKNINH